VNATQAVDGLTLDDITKAANDKGCTREQALWAVQNLSAEELTQITLPLREKHFGNKIQICTIMNARAVPCAENCTFCSQSGHNNSGFQGFGLRSHEEIMADAEKSAQAKARNFGIVTSGSTVKGASLDKICASAKEINSKAELPNACGSLGRMNTEQLQQLKDAGLTRYHHNLETSEKFYPTVCTTHDWSSRVDTVKRALAVGLNVCCGGLFGLGESWDDRADLAETIKGLGVDSVPINFLFAHEGTPMAKQPPLPTDEALRIIALYRLMMPAVTVRICGGRVLILGDRAPEMFTYGANAFMTGDYLTINGRTPKDDHLMLEEAGLVIDEKDACGR
jgi:biotin synthase